MTRLPLSFFAQRSLPVAKALLGCVLVRRIGRKLLAGKIVETEAYPGPFDRASHAFLPRENSKKISRKEFDNYFPQYAKEKADTMYRIFLQGGGKITARNKIEYEAGGFVYIYLVYGMYWQLNITTGRKGYPECVLIRALEPLHTNKHKFNLTNYTNKSIRNIRGDIRDYSRFQTNGPGKLCRWLKLNASFYGEDLTRGKRLWLAPRQEKSVTIACGPRIGIDYAGARYAGKKWRFWIKENRFVSG